MIRVILCSEEGKNRERYGKKLQDYCEHCETESDVYIYQDGNRLMEDIVRNPDITDVLYLDMLMEKSGLSGIEMAKQLRQSGFTGEIVFLISDPDCFKEELLCAFDVKAFHCIVEGFCDDEHQEGIYERVVQKAQEKRAEYIFFTGKGEQMLLMVDEIWYFEVRSRVITVHYRNGESFAFYSTMEKLEERLAGKGFLRVHRSYLISFRHVEAVSREYLKMRGGDVIPVGPSYRRMLKHSLLNTVQRLSFT